MFLVALYPPSNIAREVSRYQESIFRSLGLLACRALPPQISLGFYTDLPKKPEGKALRQPSLLEIDGLKLAESAWYLSAKPCTTIETIIGWLSGQSCRPLYPTGAGFLLSHADRKITRPDLEDKLPEAGLGWSTSTLRCIHMQFQRQAVWWENCYYEEAWSLKVRRFLQE